MNCSKNGIKIEGASCSYNNKCIYPKCITDMNKEYVIIDKSLLEKRIEELVISIPMCILPEQQHLKDLLEQELGIKRQLLSQSTPLIPKIENAFDAGVDSVIIKISDKENLTVGFSKGFTTRKVGELVELYPRIRNKYDYISKLDI